MPVPVSVSLYPCPHLRIRACARPVCVAYFECRVFRIVVWRALLSRGRNKAVYSEIITLLRLTVNAIIVRADLTGIYACNEADEQLLM